MLSKIHHLADKFGLNRYAVETPVSLGQQTAYERLATQGTTDVNHIAQFATLHAADASHIDNRLDAA